MKTVALVSKREKPEAVEIAHALKARYPHLTFLAEPHLAEKLGWPPIDDAQMSTRADLALVLGGDGTMIHAARLFKGRTVPLLGVNLGSLGFMTEVRSAEMATVFEAVLEGKGKIDSRMKLTCRLYRNDKVIVDDEVLNDVVINKSALARIADHETWMDGEFLALYKSDGVICSTPTGSTAYSLSAGGPIVHPNIDCVVLTPICPHALTQRPIVVPGDQVIRIIIKNFSSDVYLTLDGQIGHPLQPGDRVEVQRSASRAHLVRNPALGYFSVLREKLHWGTR
jgi:NAD+ kinase